MPRQRSRTIWLLTLALAAGAAVLHLAGVRPLPPQPAQQGWLWPVLVTAGFCAAELGTVHLRLGREAYAFSMMEIPLVLGLFFVHPGLLVVCRLVGATAAFTLRRKELQKAAYNLGLFAVETSAAVLVWHAVLDGGDPLGPRGWAATGCAVLLTSLLGSALVSLAIRVATGERPGSLAEVFGLGPLGDLANAAFALIGVYLLVADWRAGWLLAVVVAVLAAAYRSYEGARWRSDSLEQVNRFTETVGRDVDVEALVTSILREVAAAFEVARVELRLSLPLEGDQDWSLAGGVVGRGGSGLLDRLAPHADAGTLLASRGHRPAPLAQVLDAEHVRECLMVPLRSVGQVAGRLLVADRLSDVATMAERDVSQLQALANHAAVALENAVRAELIIREAEEREHDALHDELTGLANRRLFRSRVAGTLEHGGAAVLLLDLDRFREVNDTLGHRVGDRLLKVVADRVVEVAPVGATVARLGGDEFAVLLPDADGLDARSCGTLLRDSLARHMVLGGVTVAVDASVGIVVAERGDDAESTMRCADLAMYAAKQEHVGLEAYRPEMDRRDASRLGLLADLRDAVAQGSLEVHYQPQVEVRTGDVVGAEALVRWTHPSLGRVGPDEFIPLAEHSTLMTPLTFFVLRTALVDAARWRPLAPRLSVAVNVSPRTLLDPGFVDEVARLLAETATPPAALTLEITETQLMSDPERAMEALHRLRNVGVRLSVDDLGTGYSSLAYLQRLPVDEVKIDRSFLADITDPSARAVVGAIVDLGHRLGNEVVAEGVEDLDALEVLGDLGCDIAQGYRVGRPMPSAQLTAFLEEHPPPRPGSLRLVH